MSVPAVGIMHGRLSPPQYGSIQSFPADTWRGEFALAAEAGLACIEWIYEVRNEDRNPLRTAEGVAEIYALSKATGVGVWSICADYYMEAQLLDLNGSAVQRHTDHLEWLLGRAAGLGARYIVIPFVDSSALISSEQRQGAVVLFRRLAPIAAQHGVELHLESDLPPAVFASLLRDIGSPWVKANYDIGNSASLGYAPQNELPAIGPWLGSVHVKDRRRGGATVPLGSGDADFASCFEQFRRLGFSRWFILQAARSTEMSEVDLAAANRATVERLVAQAAQGAR